MIVLWHLLVGAIYLALPPLSLGLAARQFHNTRQIGPLGAFLANCLLAILLSFPIVLLDTIVFGGHIAMGQRLLLAYFVLAALCLLRFFDLGLLALIYRALGVRLNVAGQPLPPTRGRAIAGLILQRLILLIVVIPYVMAMLAIYRPKVVEEGNPYSRPGRPFQSVSFRTSDGVRLSGWWLPATSMPAEADSSAAERWGQQAVIVCHGLASNKSQQIDFAAYLTDNGFNVLLFDFRAHGQSGGQLATFGDLEQRDVLAAIEYVRDHHASGSRKLFGIGSNTGAAAVLAAAVAPGPGQLLDGVVLYEPYAELRTLAQTNARWLFPRPVGDWLAWVGLPIASLHTGANLVDFAPAGLVGRLWPRPLLLVHGKGRSFVPVLQGMEVYQQAFQPKQQFWPAPPQENRLRLARRGPLAAMAEMLRNYLGVAYPLRDDPAVRRKTIEFLNNAVPVPVL